MKPKQYVFFASGYSTAVSSQRIQARESGGIWLQKEQLVWSLSLIPWYSCTRFSGTSSLKSLHAHGHTMQRTQSRSASLLQHPAGLARFRFGSVLQRVQVPNISGAGLQTHQRYMAFGTRNLTYWVLNCGSVSRVLVSTSPQKGLRW